MLQVTSPPCPYIIARGHVEPPRKYRHIETKMNAHVVEGDLYPQMHLPLQKL